MSANGRFRLYKSLSMDKLLTIDEARKQLRVARSTIYNMMDRGELPFVQLRNYMRRIRESDLRRYIDKSQTHRAMLGDPEIQRMLGEMKDSVARLSAWIEAQERGEVNA